MIKYLKKSTLLNKDLSIHDVAIVIIVGTIILILLSYFIIVFFFAYKKKYIEHTEELSKIKFEFSQTLLQSQIEIQEQTFQHISRELHDNLGQVASLIKINLTTLKLDHKEKALEKIEDTKELTRQLIGDIKSLSMSLSSDRVAQTGLVKALETEAERLNKTGLFSVIFEHTGGMPAIENDAAIILYRMAQEVLNNMVKHSEATHININLTLTESLFTLAFNDDGKGFDMEQMQQKGSGLNNLQKRASLINARLQVTSSPGNGSLTTIELPV